MDYFRDYISQFFTNSKEISSNQNNIYDEKALKLKVNTPRGQGLLISSEDGLMKIQFRNKSGNEWYEYFPETSITLIHTLETPLQIINDIELWNEILYTYFDENFFEDDIYCTYWQRDFPTVTQQWIDINTDLRFNLRTLKPCGTSILQGPLDKDLIRRIKNNAAYQRFYNHKIKFDRGGALDLKGMQNYLDHYFQIEYDDTMKNDIKFQELSHENRERIIKTKHNNILNNCVGLRLNKIQQDILNPE